MLHDEPVVVDDVELTAGLIEQQRVIGQGHGLEDIRVGDAHLLVGADETQGGRAAGEVDGHRTQLVAQEQRAAEEFEGPRPVRPDEVGEHRHDAGNQDKDGQQGNRLASGRVARRRGGRVGAEGRRVACTTGHEAPQSRPTASWQWLT